MSTTLPPDGGSRDGPGTKIPEDGMTSLPSMSRLAATAPRHDPGRRRRRFILALKIAGFSILGLIVASFVGVWLVLRHYSENLPSIGDLKGNYNPPQMTRVLARDGTTLLAEIFTERRTVVSIAALPAHVKLAVLAAEDAAFYEHEGLNYYGMARALIVNLRSGRTRQGGSTITQQVVKNLLLDPERSFRRKMRELILARRLEQQISKDEILELYLNHIYFGHGRYGIEEAARYYFGKSAREITLAEGALLAGLPAGPELYSPRHDAAKSRTRRAFVLAQMLDKGFIDQRQHDVAMNEPVRLAPPVEPQGQLAPEVVELVKRTLKEVAIDSKRSGGYTVTTTIDPRLQAEIQRAQGARRCRHRRRRFAGHARRARGDGVGKRKARRLRALQSAASSAQSIRARRGPTAREPSRPRRRLAGKQSAASARARPGSSHGRARRAHA
jgi:penicillin-binding protein 1A